MSIMVFSAARADAAISLQVFDNAAVVNTVTVADGGIGDLNGLADKITFAGLVGSWDNIHVGTGPSILGSATLDLSYNASYFGNTAGPGSTLTILLSEDGIMGADANWQLQVGGTLRPGMTFTTSAFAGSGLFDMTTPLGSIGPFASSPYAGSSLTGPVILSGPFSITIRVDITAPASSLVNQSQATGDVLLEPMPEPASIGAWAVFALVGGGLFQRSRKRT